MIATLIFVFSVTTFSEWAVNHDLSPLLVVSLETIRMHATNDGNLYTSEACAALCKERNLPFQQVKNARDLASVARSPIKPGRIYRMGRVGDATDEDVKLMNEIGFKTLVDLRSPTELKDDASLLRNDFFRNFTNIIWNERRGSKKKEGYAYELKAGEDPIRQSFLWMRLSFRNRKRITPKDMVDAVSCDDAAEVIKVLEGGDEDHEYEQGHNDEELCPTFDCKEPIIVSSSRKERHFVSLMNEFKYVKGTLSKLRKWDITKSILKSPGALLSRRMRSSAKKPFLDEINDGGLYMLNELLLRFGAPGIRYVLELCAEPNRHPIGFYCTAGKDRTGIIAAIVLQLCGVDTESIVEDYTLSANVYAEMNDHQAMVGALSQRSLDPKTFLGAPPNVMRDTLAAIKNEYGSVEKYCDWIGFGPEKQKQLRRALI